MKIKATHRLKPHMAFLGSGGLLTSGDCLPRHFFADPAGAAISTKATEIITGVMGLLFT